MVDAEAKKPILHFTWQNKQYETPSALAIAMIAEYRKQLEIEFESKASRSSANGWKDLLVCFVSFVYSFLNYFIFQQVNVLFIENGKEEKTSHQVILAHVRDYK